MGTSFFSPGRARSEAFSRDRGAETALPVRQVSRGKKSRALSHRRTGSAFFIFYFFFLKKILCIFSAFEHSNYELKNASVLINEVFF